MRGKSPGQMKHLTVRIADLEKKILGTDDPRVRAVMEEILAGKVAEYEAEMRELLKEGKLWIQ